MMPVTPPASYLYNAKDTPLNLNSGTLPNVSSALFNLFTQLNFTRISKSISNFQVIEAQTQTQCLGVWQMLAPQDLQMKPEGQRSWAWYEIYSLPTLILSVDDIITYNGQNYRVMNKLDWKQCGFVSYHVCQDWQVTP